MQADLAEGAIDTIAALNVPPEVLVDAKAVKMNAIFKKLEQSDARIIILLAYPAICRALFCTALRRGVFLGPGKSWRGVFLTVFLREGWWKREAGVDTHDCTNSELRDATQGYLAVDYDTLRVSDNVALPKAGETASQWRTRYTVRSGAAGVSVFAPLAYDAVWAWALALHQLVEVEKLPVASLAQDATGLSRTKKALLKLNFPGASGQVNFDESGDRRNMPMKIENQVDGEEVTVGVFVADSSPSATLSASGLVKGTIKLKTNIVWYSSTRSMNGSWVGVGDAFVPPDGSIATEVPVVNSMTPYILDPKGGENIVIRGNGFQKDAIVVKIGAGGVCGSPRFVSSTEIQCVSPAGVGGPLWVTMTCGGFESKARRLAYYYLPTIFEVRVPSRPVDESSSWVTNGMRVRVTGAYFVDNQLLRCRIKGQSTTTLADYIDEGALECNVEFSLALGEGGLRDLEVSNDGGSRWASGVTVNDPIVWYGGSTIAVPPVTVKFPAKVVIGCMIPGVRIGGEYTLGIQACEAAATTVNAKNVFPKGTTLHIDIIDTTGNDAIAATNAVAAYVEGGVRKGGSLIGLVGGYYSGNSIGVATNVSNPRRLPYIAYDSWSSELESAETFPYFLRTCTNNNDVVDVIAVLFRDFGWKRVAVLTSDDQYARDLGSALAQKVPKLVHRGIFNEISSTASPAQIRAAANVNIKPMVDRAKNAGATIFFVEAVRSTTYLALLTAMKDAGCLEQSYAVTTNDDSALRTLVAAGEPLVDGIVAVTKVATQDCFAEWCPPVSLNGTPIRSGKRTTMAQTYDAVYALSLGLAKSFYNGDGGALYLSGDEEGRMAAMSDLRDLSLLDTQAASGSLTFTPKAGKKNNRATWDFKFGLINFVTKLESKQKYSVAVADVGAIKSTGFVPSVKPTVGGQRPSSEPIRWPGGTTERPLDFKRNDDPAQLTVGWVVESSWGDAAFQASRAMYAQQAIDQVNANPLVLPKTKLFLDFVNVDSRNASATSKSKLSLFEGLLTRSAAAGRPMAGMLGATSGLATTYLESASFGVVKQVPMVGYFTSASHLSVQKLYPNFVRNYPPVASPSEVIAKMSVKYGWSRMAVVGDVGDSWSVSWVNNLNNGRSIAESMTNGSKHRSSVTTPTTAAGAAGAAEVVGALESAAGGAASSAPYSPKTVNTEYAVLLDWKAADLATVLDQVVDVLKAKDLHIIIFALYYSDLSVFIEHALGRRILGDGYQIVVGDTISESEIQQAPAIVRAAMDGSIMIYPGGASASFPGYHTAESFWNEQPPLSAGDGAFLGGVKSIEIPYLMDAIGILAVGLEACLNSQVCSPATDAHDVVMPYIRNATFEGVAGLASFDKNTNDPKGRLFDVWSGNDGVASSSAVAAAGPQFSFTKVATTSAQFPSLEACTSPEIGGRCALTAAPPGKVSCFASSATSIQVTWERAAAQGGLLSGYRVTMGAGKDLAVSNVGASSRSVTFTMATAAGLDNKLNSKRVIFGALYTVAVESLWDNNMVVSKTTNCLTPQNGLPCIPPPIPISAGDATSAGETALGLTQRLLKDSKDVNVAMVTRAAPNAPAAVCGCKSSEYHTQHLPGYPPRFWECKPCMAGTECFGGTAATVQTMPGWFVSGNHSVGLTALGKNGSQYAIGLPKLWPCPGGASACPGGKRIVPFLSKDTRSTRSGSNSSLVDIGMGPCGDSAGDSSVQSGIECQCGAGHVGMLCRTCRDNWVTVQKVGVSAEGVSVVEDVCKQCTLDTSSIVAIILSVILVGSILGLVAMCVHSRVTKAPAVETAFFHAFSDMQTVGAARAVDNFFGEGSRAGVTKELFISVCTVKLATRGELGQRALLKLFDKIDEDGDGVVSLKELVKLLYGLKDGSLSSSKPRARCSNWLQ